MNCLRQFSLSLAVFCIFPALVAQNDIQVLGDAVFTPAELSEGAAASFLIRFQNVGKDTVYQVIIRDTLDPRFEIASFSMLGASHSYALAQDGNNHVIRWYFDDIFLPDSASGGANSVGFILYKIQLRNFLAPGQTILNHACATFNQTATICTEDAFVWIDENPNMAEPDQAPTYQIVPNPNYGNFEVWSDAPSLSDPSKPPAEWWITDINGKTVWDGFSKNTSTASTLVWLERPPPGLYLLWIKDHKRLQVKEFVVLR